MHSLVIDVENLDIENMDNIGHTIVIRSMVAYHRLKALAEYADMAIDDYLIMVAEQAESFEMDQMRIVSERE